MELQIDLGISPEKQFLVRDKVDNCLRSNNSEGMVPVILFSLKSMIFSWVIFELKIPSKLPVKEFCLNINLFNDDNLCNLEIVRNIYKLSYDIEIAFTY